MFSTTVTALLEWMESTTCDRNLIDCIGEYLHTYGEVSMTTMTSHLPYLGHWGGQYDILGWDNFLEGRISHSLFDLKTACMHDKQSKHHIRTWATQFIKRILVSHINSGYTGT